LLPVGSDDPHLFGADAFVYQVLLYLHHLL